MDKCSNERRCALRFPAYVEMRYESNRVDATATAHDISVSGAFIRSDIVDEPGTEALITIHSYVNRDPVEIHSRVARSSAGPLAGMGLEFHELCNHGKTFVEQYCAPLTASHRVVMVDDNPIILRMMKRLILRENMAFIGIDLPVQTEEIIERFSPHLIILDIMLPGRDGFEIAERLTENQNTRDIPIIFYSAMPRETIRENFFKPTHYLTKGCSLNDVSQTIRAALGTSLNN